MIWSIKFTVISFIFITEFNNKLGVNYILVKFISVSLNLKFFSAHWAIHCMASFIIFFTDENFILIKIRNITFFNLYFSQFFFLWILFRVVILVNTPVYVQILSKFSHIYVVRVIMLIKHDNIGNNINIIKRNSLSFCGLLILHMSVLMPGNQKIKENN